MNRTSSFLLCFLAAASVLAGCGRRPSCNVLVLTLDTTRRDHLGCYGDSAARTPNLDSLAADGVRFERCWSVAPITLAAHASIFTGLYPPGHGVRDNGLYRLDEHIPTLATLLSGAGYRPGAVVGAYVLASRFGLARGFTDYDERLPRAAGAAAGFIVERNADAVTAAGLAWLRTRPAGKPFALWLHYFDPHAPYRPPAPFDSLFRGRPYDGEIAYMDSRLGQVLAYLKETGRYDNTLIVAVADHGEALGEHGEPSHGIFMYDGTVRVPLILRLPRGEAAGKVIARNVSQVDLLPTLLDYLGLKAPEGLQGQSLLPLVRGEPGAGPDSLRALYMETHLPENSFGWAPLAGFVRGEEKFIHAPEPELYDLAADPGETANLAGADSPALTRAENRLTALEHKLTVERAGGGGALSVEAESAQRLRALGYVSASLPGAPPPGGRPDPKSMIRTLGRFLEGVVLEADGAYDSSLVAFERVLKDNPDNAFAHLYRGFIFWRQERFPAALEEFRTAVEINPLCEGDYLLGMVYSRLDSLDEAHYWLEHRLARNPSHARANFLLAEVYLSQGRADSALAALQSARRYAPQDKEILNDLGKLLLDRGETKEAAGCFEQALSVDSLYPLALYNLGLAAYRLGDLPRAETCLRKVAARFSRDEKAQNNLGVVLAADGRAEDAERAYRAALAADSLYAPAWNNLGNLSADRKNAREAERYYVRALELDSLYAQASLNLGLLYLNALDQPEKAKEYLSRALRLEPQAGWADKARALLAGAGQ